MALRSNVTSLAFARLYPFEPGIRRERVRPTLRRSAIVALSGAGLEMVQMLPLLSAIVASDLSPRSTPARGSFSDVVIGDGEITLVLIASWHETNSLPHLSDRVQLSNRALFLARWRCMTILALLKPLSCNL